MKMDFVTNKIRNSNYIYIVNIYCATKLKLKLKLELFNSSQLTCCYVDLSIV